ncbi:MAG TPA: hypothetical protein VME92_11950 [Acetobacteraceae bacterium]|nr:hypothetical protein [Acetobacteraceae bacterium]
MSRRLSPQRLDQGARQSTSGGDRLAEAGPVDAPTASWRNAPGNRLGTPDAPLALAHTDWLRHWLTVSGPAGEVARFRAAACGTSGVPWYLDLDHEEARLLAPMAMLGPAARALARELREVIASRHDRVRARWAEPGTCPLDLHRLIPVPDAILQLGADAPTARHWLWTQWGTSLPLRQVRVLEATTDRRLRRSARVVYAFLSADWTPWQAITRLRRDWPSLVLDIRPFYDDAGGAPDA